MLERVSAQPRHLVKDFKLLTDIVASYRLQITDYRLLTTDYAKKDQHLSIFGQALQAAHSIN